MATTQEDAEAVDVRRGKKCSNSMREESVLKRYWPHLELGKSEAEPNLVIEQSRKTSGYLSMQDVTKIGVASSRAEFQAQMKQLHRKKGDAANAIIHHLQSEAERGVPAVQQGRNSPPLRRINGSPACKTDTLAGRRKKRRGFSVCQRGILGSEYILVRD